MRPHVILPEGANIPPEWIVNDDEESFSVVVPSWSQKGESHLISISKKDSVMRCECLAFDMGKICHHIKGLVWFCYKRKSRKSGVAETSIDSLAQFSPDDLGERQAEIYEMLSKSCLPLSDNDLSARLGVPINCVTGRRNELVKMGVVAEAGTRWDAFTNRTVIVWTVI